MYHINYSFGYVYVWVCKQENVRLYSCFFLQKNVHEKSRTSVEASSPQTNNIQFSIIVYNSNIHTEMNNNYSLKPESAQ